MWVSNTPTPKEDTTLHKTWSHLYLIEMGNGIANNDFETYAFYMNEYEEELKIESNRRTLDKDELATRYGDPEHEYYIQTTMKMAEGDYASAYFYLNRYIDVMRNRFCTIWIGNQFHHIQNNFLCLYKK